MLFQNSNILLTTKVEVVPRFLMKLTIFPSYYHIPDILAVHIEILRCSFMLSSPALLNNACEQQ